MTACHEINGPDMYGAQLLQTGLSQKGHFKAVIDAAFLLGLSLK